MDPIQKKVCLLGAFAVGKTSLIRRYVNSLFADKYLTTVGVKVEKKTVSTANADVKLLIWDLAGQDDFTQVNLSYLRGASVCVVGVDGTRGHTAEVAIELVRLARETVPGIPCVIAVNKLDLHNEWDLDEPAFYKQLDNSIPVLHTSAKTGAEVEDLFLKVAELSVLDRRKAA